MIPALRSRRAGPPDRGGPALCDWQPRPGRGGVRLHCVEAGAGPPVVLLHGFPEFWYSWRHQLPALADAGFRAVAPDLRGYNLSDKPRGVESYRIEALVGDVADLIARLPGGRACVVGHDWGGVIGWWLGMLCPERVSRLVILNAPHPGAYLRELLHGDQALRSWYVLFFQVPVLPELLLRVGNFAAVGRALKRGPVAHAFTDEDIRRYKEALARPGALHAAVNYYRAAFRHLGSTSRRLRVIPVRTLLVWGERDPFLSPRLTEGLNSWVPDLRVERIADAGHWVQNESPERVNRLLIEFGREQAGEGDMP